MKRILLMGMLLPFCLKAQDYRASLIPDSLKENADAVKRFEELHVIIKGIDKAVVKRHYVITVLNEHGDRYAEYINEYTKLISLGDISGRLLDADGRQIRSVKKKDIADMSADDDANLLTDARFKRYSFYYKTYPYTIEFEDEEDYDGIFSLPVWDPVERQKLAVQQSRFIVETPIDYQLRYKAFNYRSNPVVTNNKTITYTWELTNQKPVLYEVFQPDWQEMEPAVFIAPTDFSIGNYKGNMSTWNSFGQFITALNSNRNELPDHIKKDIHLLTDGITDKKTKVNAVYNYLQQNTRYISIQLGIGSWQPFEAKYVAEKKYGDCKALSNYMVSLLKEAGIAANYVLITAGEGRKGLMDDFPSPYFNHAIACVPDGKDTIWLECTDQTVSPGYMGSFTGNRKALMITETGGVPVQTPVYNAADNKQVRRVTATIDAEGTLTADVRTHFTGIQQELTHSLLHENTREQRDKYLNNQLSLPTYKVEKIEYTETKGTIPAMDEHLQVTSPNYASITGKRLFITPNLFNKEQKLSVDKPRKFDIEFRWAYKDVDSIFIAIPAGYSIESLPKEVAINNKFGAYHISYDVHDNSITLVRSREHHAERYPASDYADMAKFYDELYKADRARIVMVKKE